MSTIRDIAAAAGVSISTVSHVVNKTRYVSPELVDRVEAAVASMDSPPNFIVKKKTAENAAPLQQFVAVISTDERDKIFEYNITKELSSAGFAAALLSCKTDAEKAICTELVKMPSCAGIVFWTANSTEPLDPALKIGRLPRVVVSLAERSDGEDVVYPDISEGTHQAILHLLRSGHELIAFLGKEPNAALTAFRETTDSFGISDMPVYLGLQEEPHFFETLDALFHRQSPPTALFVSHTDILVPLLRYLETNNIRCPEDVSIICLGDFEWASLYKPAITTVPLGRARMVRAAVDILRLQIAQRHCSYEKENVKLPTKLLFRASTAGIPRGPFGERGVEPCALQLSAADKVAIADGKYTAAISLHYTGCAWDDLLIKGITDVFRSLRINIIATTDAHFDPALQARQLESFGHLLPDIVIGMPTNDTLTADSFLSLKGTSKLVFLGHVPQGFSEKDYISCISVNDREYGRYAAQALVEQMQHHSVTNVGMLMRGGNFFSTHQRDMAAKQLFSERDGVTLCGTACFELESNAYAATLDLMHRHPEINCLYVSWEGPAMEAIRALQEIGRTDVVISTCDLEYASAMVFAGKGMIQCINAQKPYEQGRAAATAAAMALLGHEVSSYIAVEPVKITHTNLLKVWKEIYKEDAPAELQKCLRQTANYAEQGMD